MEEEEEVDIVGGYDSLMSKNEREMLVNKLATKLLHTKIKYYYLISPHPLQFVHKFRSNPFVRIHRSSTMATRQCRRHRIVAGQFSQTKFTGRNGNGTGRGGDRGTGTN